MCAMWAWNTFTVYVRSPCRYGDEQLPTPSFFSLCLCALTNERWAGPYRVGCIVVVGYSQWLKPRNVSAPSFHSVPVGRGARRHCARAAHDRLGSGRRRLDNAAGAGKMMAVRKKKGQVWYCKAGLLRARFRRLGRWTELEVRVLKSFSPLDDVVRRHGLIFHRLVFEMSQWIVQTETLTSGVYWSVRPEWLSLFGPLYNVVYVSDDNVCSFALEIMKKKVS